MSSDEPSLPVADEARVGVLTAAVTLTAGAPVGLLWGWLAPRAEAVVTGTDVDLVNPSSSAFIAAEGYFLAAVVLAGVVSGLATWALARPGGPGAVLGLALGGLGAACVAMVVGQQVGYEEVRAAVDAGREGPLLLSLRLRAPEAVVGWPVGGLLAYVAAALHELRR